MNKLAFRTLAGLSVAGALAAGTGLVHAQQQGQVVQARVVSATPVRETTGSDVSYNVTYEYNGQRYTTRMNSRPGATIPIQASGYGVTTSAVAPQAQVQTYPVEASGSGYQQQQSGGSPWDNVVPEPGVVVGAGGPAPVYAQPAPVYAPAPVYVDPGYAYAYPPVGISLNLGYSRGWGGGYYGHGYRGWGGGYRGGWHR
ncbi:hypothetical protein [Variovorax sp. RCC_210]|uniref:hypothetical protein n=1 Tax=Variovorax sp. RCC_210 TaxID=3239217 RepID=UPI00352374CE